MASLCLCKPPLASEPASHVKLVTKQTFGRASPRAAREAAPEALPNRASEREPRMSMMLGSQEEAGNAAHAALLYRYGDDAASTWRNHEPSRGRGVRKPHPAMSAAAMHACMLAQRTGRHRSPRRPPAAAAGFLPAGVAKVERTVAGWVRGRAGPRGLKAELRQPPPRTVTEHLPGARAYAPPSVGGATFGQGAKVRRPVNQKTEDETNACSC